MLTVNIEKELARQVVDDIAKAERLLKQANITLGRASENDQKLLDRAGLGGAANVVSSAKHDVSNHKKMIEGHAYHLEQIKALCYKYHLRFLPTQYFAGPIDPGIIEKLRAIEKEIPKEPDYYFANLDDLTFHIMAPASAFKLAARPIDPLLFFRVPNTDYHRLIHQWGNDLSIFRAVLGIVHLLFADIRWNSPYKM